MKATIDGIACDGTPEEINEFKKLRDAINHDKLWKDLDRKKGVEPPLNPFRSGSVDAIGKDIYVSTENNPYTVTLKKGEKVIPVNAKE